MMPLIACFPVVLTFAALALLALIAVATGMVKSDEDKQGGRCAESDAPAPFEGEFPRWWTIAVIVLLVVMLVILLAMISGS
ncbi:MAG TPA: hypothetical protein VLM40_02330 [Gemmata sp.]|nr:hypothetical protein [Gemmata sp.]